MRYFTVEKEVMRSTYSYEVASDGSQIGESWECDRPEVTVGFNVHIYEEWGEHVDTKFYPVTTDLRTYEGNEGEVLEKIKADFPPTEYQNNEW